MNKTYISTQKYFLGSPRKLRAVAALVKKMKPVDAVAKLPFAERRAAGDLSKVIKSALANAKNQGESDVNLVFKEIQIGEGPRLKRGKAASRGRWHQFKRRMSHIRVVLTTVGKEKEEVKPVTVAEEVKVEKKEVKAKVVKEKGDKKTSA
jgi:large subunit ribosomal protein L22